MVRIAHLADIHIQDRRRAEYAAVFARLYESLRKEAPDIIVVAGDVFDQKMRASPNNMADVAAFLKALADIAPVVMIPGNHDTNVLTPGSLDLLTPLLADHRDLQPPRLTYWRHSGVHVAHGMVWTVIATDGEPPSEAAERKVIEGAGLEAAPHLCLFHEEVNGTLLPNGQQLRDFKLSRGTFAKYDLTMGGHIHRRQWFSVKEPRAAYCGSLIQQNIGESHRSHGYIMWELSPSTSHAPYRTPPPLTRGVDILNDNGFVRVEIDEAGDDVTSRPLPRAPLYWEAVHFEDTPPTRVANLVAKYEKEFVMPPRAVRTRPRNGAPPPGSQPPKPSNENGHATAEAAEKTALSLAQAAASTRDAHEAIIRELLEGDDLVEAVIALHRERYHEPNRAQSGGRFRLVRLEFDNLYAFGPANAVDFEALEGCVSGVIAPNHTGKSSLIEALLFALYESHPRAPSKKDVIHLGAGSCRLSLEFELDGQRGRVEKGFDGGSSRGASRYRFMYAGEDRTRGGTAETLAEVASVLGGAETALASSFQLQGEEGGGFIRSSPPNRRKLLAAVLSLGSFEALERSVGKELTAAGAVVKELAAQYGGVPAVELELLRDTEQGDLDDLQAEIQTLVTTVDAAQAATLGAAEVFGAEASRAAAARAKAARASEDLCAAQRSSVFGDDDASPGKEKCVAVQAAWGALVGEITPAEEAAVAQIPGIVPLGDLAAQPDALAAARHSAQVAVERARAAQATAHECRLALAAAPEPRITPTEALKVLAAAETRLANASAAAAAAAAADKAPPSLKPPTRDPIISLAAVSGERSGERPSDAAQVSAAATLIQARAEANQAAAPSLEDLAAQWNPAEHQRLTEAIAKLGAPGTASSPAFDPSALSAAEAASSAAERTSAALRAEIEVAKAEWALEQEPGTECVEDLDAARGSLQGARSWAAAVAHLDQIRARLRPIPDCAGCTHAMAVLGEHAADDARIALSDAERSYRHALVAALAKAHSEQELASTALATVRAAAVAAQKAVAIGAASRKLAAMERARAAANQLKSLSEAIAVLEVANYWHREDQRSYENLQAGWEASRRRRLEAVASELEGAKAHLEATRAQLANSEADAKAHKAASQSCMGASSLEEAALATANIAQTDLTRLEAARKRAVGAMSWWKAAAAEAERISDLRAAMAAAAAQAQAAAKREEVAAADKTVAAASYQKAMGLLSEAQGRAASAAREMARLTVLLDTERAREAKHATALAHQAALKSYRAILRPTGGIGDRLLEQGRALLERRVNEGLRELGAQFEIEIAPDYDVRQRTSSSGAWLPASLGSGYQKFVLSLAARLAIWRLSASPRPDAFIIDEGFGACDEEYLEAMAGALGALVEAPGGPKLVFVVSHLDALKVRLERTLEIETSPAGSRIANAAPCQVARPVGKPAPPRRATPPEPKRRGPGGAAAAEAKAAAEEKGPAHGALGALVPDPDKAGNLYCEACRQSLGSGWGPRHLGSDKHAAAVLRAAKASSK